MPSLKPSLQLNDAGYSIEEDLVSDRDLDLVLQDIPEPLAGHAGTRLLDRIDSVNRLAVAIRESLVLRGYSFGHLRPYWANYFVKNAERNWIVPMHRDDRAPIAMTTGALPDFLSDESVKEGRRYAKVSRTVLAEFWSVRLSCDASDSHNAPLKVHPGSHRDDQSPHPVTECIVGKGGGLIVSPNILHSSGKNVSGCPRRIIHFTFGPGKYAEFFQFIPTPG